MANPPLSFKSVPLYGGAITADLPSDFQDVSTIRQVPDTQEVHLSSTGDTSIVFDLLERVDKPTDEEAVKFHFEDILEDEMEGVRVWGGVEEVRVPDLPGVKAFTMFATSPPGEKQRGRAHEADFVGILLLVVRLEGKGTDLVVAVNVPHVEGEGGYVRGSVDLEGAKMGRLLEEGEGVRERVRESLRVVDWGLFGE
ncbi:hypothetical protein M409DRAFT_19390 [Zasmidium cellare ATCC 36951]|uniref:Mog1p/PsbP-like protein n=1 Tax=Zasmidium cellare ATCC 36951 TaxID=1080233 RepID=A0A6A6CXI2_ZASCE|nr:uncharacterized protein M409DRAFT_19390 [Zasmidium cellare ATCC 36951]KAF2170572.1 hypothetical protein M409DRAFT_19390 [Zasmidium cellare ATCC 36951]